MRQLGSVHAAMVWEEFGVIVVRMDTSIWMDSLGVSLVTVTQATLLAICVTRWSSLDSLVLLKYAQMSYKVIFTLFYYASRLLASVLVKQDMVENGARSVQPIILEILTFSACVRDLTLETKFNLNFNFVVIH